MKIGVNLAINETTVPISDAAPAAEERGFESLMVGEHTHCPVATVHSYTKGRYGTGKVTKNGYVPDIYKRFPDPYVTLTAAAMCTRTIRLGTCVALPAEHNPLVLAKTIATLDQLSGGRFEFGIGYGWNELEMRNNGFEKSQRRDVLREKVQALKALWTQETASFNGTHVRFTESWSYPKPVQRPHPPILIGAAALPHVVEDIVGWADGWIPVRVFSGDEMLASDIARVRQHAEEMGRDPATIAITLVEAEPGFRGKRSRDAFLESLPKPEQLAAYAELGIRRLTLGLPIPDIDSMLWGFDQIVRLRDQAGLA